MDFPLYQKRSLFKGHSNKEKKKTKTKIRKKNKQKITRNKQIKMLK